MKWQPTVSKSHMTSHSHSFIITMAVFWFLIDCNYCNSRNKRITYLANMKFTMLILHVTFLHFHSWFCCKHNGNGIVIIIYLFKSQRYICNHFYASLGQTLHRASFDLQFGGQNAVYISIHLPIVSMHIVIRWVSVFPAMKWMNLLYIAAVMYHLALKTVILLIITYFRRLCFTWILHYWSILCAVNYVVCCGNFCNSFCRRFLSTCSIIKLTGCSTAVFLTDLLSRA